jgi:hypothetical protein
MDERVGRLINEIKNFRSLLSPDGDYQISRKDGKRMGIGEVMEVGGIQHRIDLLLVMIDKGGE